MSPFERAKQIVALIEPWNNDRRERVTMAIKELIQEIIRDEWAWCCRLAENYHSSETELLHPEQTAIEKATGMGISRGIRARFFT